MEREKYQMLKNLLNEDYQSDQMGVRYFDTGRHSKKKDESKGGLIMGGLIMGGCGELCEKCKDKLHSGGLVMGGLVMGGAKNIYYDDDMLDVMAQSRNRAGLVMGGKAKKGKKAKKKRKPNKWHIFVKEHYSRVEKILSKKGKKPKAPEVSKFLSKIWKKAGKDMAKADDIMSAF